MIIQLENHVNNDRNEINVDGHLVEEVMVTDQRKIMTLE